MFRVQIRRSLHDEGDFRVVLIVIAVCGDFCLLTLAVKPVTPVKFLNVLEITKNGHSKYDYRTIEYFSHECIALCNSPGRKF